MERIRRWLISDLKIAPRSDELRIVWPGGRTQQTFQNIPVNTTLLIEEDNTCPILLPSTVSSPSYRFARSELLQREHKEYFVKTKAG